MFRNPLELPRRSVGEWSVCSTKPYKNPFADVEVKATLTAPSGQVFQMGGFYDGVDAEGVNVWRVRFNPGEVGRWSLEISSYPANPDLFRRVEFQVASSDAEGFVKPTVGKAFGFHYESGKAVFPLGDTIYNLFGYAHCGNEVSTFLSHRASQGYNYLRVRVAVSSFHGPDSPNRWQTRSTLLWGGGEQSPQFHRFNLEYFHTVDQVMEIAQQGGIGFEMILEAWGFDFPFNSRQIFTAEWEEFYFRYVIARYDAFDSVWFWTLMNEYEYYPDGHMRTNMSSDFWAIRNAKYFKRHAPHEHPVTVHNGRQDAPFAERFASDPEAIDTIMLQVWGNWKEKINYCMKGWTNTAIFAEYGYERNEQLPLTYPGFWNKTTRHTRLGAWHGAFHGMGVANGFENTWAPFMLLDQDQEGVAYLPPVRRFFEKMAGMDLRPADDLLSFDDQHFDTDNEPLAMFCESNKKMAFYFPGGGYAKLTVPYSAQYLRGKWYDPRSGSIASESTLESIARTPVKIVAPGGIDKNGDPLDWVLLLTCPD